ncbi:Hsp20/alpha crystallin family protein [Salipaludibacillus neizhouensis]|uniref:Hsp20/alpha crystallin family protein n=1 Tax=Salipaludibacillus neizhouensis TaxID=885475 RepID=UPI0016044A43|nr:Hsp20/alpha crystallin family protein [Salipaludibacillus neizhouensis]
MEDYSQNWNKPFKKFFEDDFWSSFNGIFDGNDHHQPKANVYESGNELICLIFLPGIKKLDDIRLNINEKTLEVSGTSSLENNGFHLIQKELYEGPFKRIVELPFSVRRDKMDAFYQRGLLTVHLYRLIENNKSNHGVSIRDED